MDGTTTSESSFLKLYDEHAEPLFRHCYFRVSSREIAEDLTQEAFARVWNYLAKGNTIQNPKAFLYRTASNLIVDHYRDKKEASLDALKDEGFDPVGDTGQSIVAFASGEHAKQMLRKLETPYRETLILRYVDDLSISEIAEAMGESGNVVSVRIHRGIEKLRDIFHHERPS